MATGKRVVLALRRRGEGLDAAQLSVGTELITTPRQNLMSVSLMAHIPHDSVFWGVKNIMKRNSYLNHTKTGSQMARINSHLLHDILA